MDSQDLHICLYVWIRLCLLSLTFPPFFPPVSSPKSCVPTHVHPNLNSHCSVHAQCKSVQPEENTLIARVSTDASEPIVGPGPCYLI